MAFTLIKAGGGYAQGDYLSVSNSVASPANSWYASNSTDGGGNSGWTFYDFLSLAVTIVNAVRFR